MAKRIRSTPRPGQPSAALAYLRLARLHFLGGGFLLFGLGAAIARFEHFPFAGGLAYLAGQAVVTCLQLMTHFLNEYWDADADRGNRNRTWFSGGSGMLPAGAVDRETTYMLAIFCLVGAFAAALGLVVMFQVKFISVVIIAAAAAGAWFYSSPPLRLASSGIGEFTASLVVAGLVPAFGYSLHAGGLSPMILWACAPLLALHVAMLLAFELPDAESDAAAGKRTLLVRLGLDRGDAAHRLALLAAYLLLLAGGAAGLPLLVALSGALPFPLALAQGYTFNSLARRQHAGQGQGLRYQGFTFGAVALFALTAALLTAAFWRIR